VSQRTPEEAATMSDTPKSILEQAIPELLTAKPELAKELNAVIHFVITGDQGGNVDAGHHPRVGLREERCGRDAEDDRHRQRPGLREDSQQAAERRRWRRCRGS
jgi:hypothetical protein